MRSSLLLLLVATLAAGCTTVRTVDPDGKTSYQRVTDKADGRLVHVTLDDGREMKVFSLRVMPETTSWIDPKTNKVVEVPTAELREVTIFKPLKGALVGIGAAAVLGTAAGIARAVSEGDDAPDAELSLTQQEKMPRYAGAFAAYTSVLTIPAGAFRQRATYRFD